MQMLMITSFQQDRDFYR